MPAMPCARARSIGEVGHLAHRHVTEGAAAVETDERPEIELDLGALARLEEAG